MVFSSPIFLFIFLPVVLCLYLIVRKEYRNILLFVASLFFYFWGEGIYTLVMLFSICLNYCLALLINRHNADKGKSRLFLILAVVCNLLLLVFFKYAGFISGIAASAGKVFGLAINRVSIHLPVGISFFTFHALSYVIDIYRKQRPPQKKLFNVGLYIVLFPQLIAGPIIRYKDIARQISSRKSDIISFGYGVQRFILGLGKKILIADVLGSVADKIFNIIEVDMTFSLAWLGIICYALQIFFDFSGYSDMALGLARMFGFKFKENFLYPYISQSIKEFWQRWHISLSTWFRDYLYIPLGGNRCGSLRTYFNLILVFFLCGLWHGASWNFVLWGLYYGVFLIFERGWFGEALSNLWRPLRHLYVFLVVCFGWVLFRASSLYQAKYYLFSLLGMAKGDGAVYYPGLYLKNSVVLALVIGIIASTPIVHLFERQRKKIPYANSAHFNFGYNIAVSLGVVVVLSFSILSLAGKSYNPFIYFRF